jgi:hypothetical protein
VLHDVGLFWILAFCVVSVVCLDRADGRRRSGESKN